MLRRRRRVAAQFDFARLVESVVQYGEEQGYAAYDYEEVPLFEFALNRIGTSQSSEAFIHLLRSVPDKALLGILGEDSFTHEDTVHDSLRVVIAHAAVNAAFTYLM